MPRFVKMTDSGLPISPTLCSASLSAVAIATSRTGPSAFDSQEATDRAQHEGRAKVSAKDALDITTFRGTCSPERFSQLVTVELPVFSELLQAVRITLSQVLEQCYPSDAEIIKFLRGQLGSLNGITNTTATSIIIFQARRITDFRTLLECLARTATVIHALMGEKPYQSFQLLVQLLLVELQPSTPSYNDTKLGIFRAIDIVNAGMFRVFHHPPLKACSPNERWALMVANATTSTEWISARTDQVHVNQQDAIRLAVANSHSKPNQNQPRGNGKGKGDKNGKRGNTSEPATPPDPDEAPADTRPPPLCDKQFLDEGCPYGLRCRYTHDAAHPKVARPPAAKKQRK